MPRFSSLVMQILFVSVILIFPLSKSSKPDNFFHIKISQLILQIMNIHVDKMLFKSSSHFQHYSSHSEANTEISIKLLIQ